jgi:hypothetical protein
MVCVRSGGENPTKSRNECAGLASLVGNAHIGWMLHLVKLAVGIRDVAHLAEVQKRRALTDPPLRHQTRQQPRRAAEIIDGGSIYWVIQGGIVVRQRIVDIRQEAEADGTNCAGLLLDPVLVPVAATKMRPFQGWRYLSAEDAPPDIVTGEVKADEMPQELQRALRDLALL